jgi:hypothetical protein
MVQSDLKGQCPDIFNFRFFHETVSPKPPSIPLGPFRIFSKIHGDIRSSICTTGVVDTGGKLTPAVRTGGKLPPVSLIPVICGSPGLAKITANFRKKSK